MPHWCWSPPSRHAAFRLTMHLSTPATAQCKGRWGTRRKIEPPPLLLVFAAIASGGIGDRQDTPNSRQGTFTDPTADEIDSITWHSWARRGWHVPIEEPAHLPRRTQLVDDQAPIGIAGNDADLIRVRNADPHPASRSMGKISRANPIATRSPGESNVAPASRVASFDDTQPSSARHARRIRCWARSLIANSRSTKNTAVQRREEREGERTLGPFVRTTRRAATGALGAGGAIPGCRG
jgi:hypothetical protein